MTNTAKQYNYCLDFLKGIACIFVVFMHCEFPGLMGVAVQAVSRFCVPFFFMVSGYFCYKPVTVEGASKFDDKTRIKKKIIHIAKITLYASLFYLAFVLIQQVFFHHKDFTLTWKGFINWVVFNEPIVVAHQYWFLFALLYAYIFYGIVERLHLRKFSYILAAIMFAVYISMAQGIHLVGISIPNYIYRNWLVEAFPFFTFGHWIHENQERIHITNKVLITIIVVTTILCWVERWIMGRDFGVNIITIPQVFALFVYGVKNPTHHEGVIQRLGRDCSMLVYIFHPAVWHSLDGVYKIAGLSSNMPALYLKPILVLTISILLALLFNAILSSFDKRKQKVTIQ
ncbi:MAG: acyltransferase [Bacteroidales bacterium]|nr:acyltransferase [Bacteroidales bacterium]